ncbi:MAG: hypothetical protein AAFZ91_04950 [Pseudomonadota bacterium]
MTNADMSLGSIFKESLDGARAVIVPSLPWLALFAFVAGYRAWTSAGLAGSQASLAVEAGLFLCLLYVGCLFSAVMYKRLLPETGSKLRSIALRLSLANLLLYMAVLIILFILALFLSIFSGVMVGLTDYDPSNADPSEIASSLAALQESGTIWPLYILLAASIAGMVWFALRMIVFGAATVAAGKVTVFQSWAWTKRHVLKILGLAIVLQALVFAVLFAAGEALTNALGVPSTLLLTFERESTLQFEFGEAERTLDQIGIGTAIRTFLLAPFWWLGHALAVALYRRLAPEDQAITPASSN